MTEPAAGRSVGNHTMRRVGPAQPEQLGQHRALGLQAAQLVIRMGAALIAEEEARTQNGSDRTGIERLPHAFAVNDPPGGQNRDLDRSPNALDQFEQRRPTANVPAGLDALSYHRVGSRRLSHSCLIN